MKIKSVSITNVKSFKSETIIEFDSDFNIIVGPNASGKSNLLDIVTICVRKYFLKTYNIQNTNNSKDIQPQNIFNDIKGNLDKYLNCYEDSLISFTFLVKQEDIDNIKLFRENKTGFVQRLNEHTGNSAHFGQQFSAINWDENLLSFNKEITFEIKKFQLIGLNNPVLSTPPLNFQIKSKQVMFLGYLNYFELFTALYSKETYNKIQPNFLFLSPYRASTGPQDFTASLSNQSSRSLIQVMGSSTSKTTTSLINLATTYFAEKMRLLETAASTVGYDAAWNADPEVRIVSSYLLKLGYSWKIKLIDLNKNTYEIELTKEGQTLLLAQASSGEKEIINYLFGIFALKLKNGIIIIDEPELHLHPRWQLLLLDLFMELTKTTGNQFIITTHSPVFIQSNSVSNLIRIYRSKLESHHVSLLGKTSSSLKDLLHIVNSTNNEKIFFADAVILVEGITDRLVFQKIAAILLAELNILAVVEVVEINGKNNINKFREFLNQLKIPNYFIADLDYVNEVGTSEVKNLFVVNKEKVDKFVIKNKSGTDAKKLIDVLDEAIASNKLEELKAFSDYIKSFRRKLKTPLNAKEQNSLDDLILNNNKKGTYILKKGDIENYFPEKLKAKDLENVLELLTEKNLNSWRISDDYKLLENIIKEIISNEFLSTIEDRKKDNKLLSITENDLSSDKK